MPYIRQRGESWSFTIDIGKDPITGKRKQKTVGGFKSDKEAMRAAYKMEEQVERGQSVGAPKLADFTHMFFEEHVKHQVSSTTYYNQKHFAEKFILPALGHFPIDKITHVQVEHFYTDLLKKDISRGLIRNISLVLRKTFRTANKWGYIHNNIMQHVKPPKYQPAKMKVWTKEQVQEFLQKSVDSPNHVLYVLALSTGMRLGELLGLQWEDIDFNTGMLQVKRSLKYDVTKRELIFKEPKNAHSKRTISLPESTLNALKAHKMASLPSQLVFHHIGAQIHPSETSRKFQSEVKKYGLPVIRFHDLRHTHATLLLLMGMNPKVVAERLGHSTVTTTLDTYSHVMPSMQKEVADRLNAVFSL